MVRSVLNIQTAYAKALLVNWEVLELAQSMGDVLGAELAIREAFEQDVTPLLYSFREELGLPVNPMKTFMESDYLKKIKSRRKGGANW